MRLAGLEKRYKSSQKDTETLQEITTKLEAELLAKDGSIRTVRNSCSPKFRRSQLEDGHTNRTRSFWQVARAISQ